MSTAHDLQQAVLCAKWLIGKLQEQLLAHKQDPHTSSTRLRGLLLKLHHRVHESLVGYWNARDDSPSRDTNVNTLVTALQEACRQAAQALPDTEGASEQLAHAPEQVARSVLEERERALQTETAGILSLAAAQQQDTGAVSSLEQQGAAPQLSLESAQRLVKAVSQLRQTEESIDFLAELASEVAEMTDSTDMSDENFAYGSTTFTSWWKVVSDSAVWPVIQAALTSGSADNATCPQQYMVWGSSSGWLVLYGHIACGWHSVGVELLPCLVRHAKRVRDTSCDGQGTNVAFMQGDLLHSDLSNVGVLLLANQCWDKALVSQASAKVESELPPGSVVIEYTGALRRCKRLTLITVCEVPVSWNAQQRMHVWQAA